MNFKDLEIGSEYCLANTHRNTRVTVLETPDEQRRRSRVRVRIESGVTAGRVIDVWVGHIKHRWGQSLALPRKRRPSLFVEEGAWPPIEGETVHWQRTVGIEWEVVETADDGRTTVIEGTLFGMRQTRTVPLDELIPIANVVAADGDESRTPPEVEPQVSDGGAVARGKPTGTERQRRISSDESLLLNRVVDCLTFSNSCLKQYRSMFARRVPWARLAVHLANYLRANGEPCRIGREYLTIRTPRFDVRVVDYPTTECPQEVTYLIVGKKRRRPPRRPKNVDDITIRRLEKASR